MKEGSKIFIAKKLRKTSTKAEALLWKYLSNRGMCGFKFRRQHPMSGFILDFFCPSEKLGIEIDGEIHLKQKEYDAARQNIIESKGVKILRFKNEQVFNDLNEVLKQIKRSIIPSQQSGE